MLNDKGLAKNHWVKLSGIPVVSTNQIFIEDVLYVVIKIIKKHQVKVRYNKHKKTTKHWMKSMPMYRVWGEQL